MFLTLKKIRRRKRNLVRPTILGQSLDNNPNNGAVFYTRNSRICFPESTINQAETSLENKFVLKRKLKKTPETNTSKLSIEEQLPCTVPNEPTSSTINDHQPTELVLLPSRDVIEPSLSLNISSPSNVIIESLPSIPQSSSDTKEHLKITKHMSLFIILVTFGFIFNILFFVFGYMSIIYYVFCATLDFFMYGLPHYWILSSLEILQFIKRRFHQAKLKFGIF